MIKNIIMYAIFIIISAVLALIATYYRYSYLISQNNEKNPSDETKTSENDEKDELRVSDDLTVSHQTSNSDDGVLQSDTHAEDINSLSKSNSETVKVESEQVEAENKKDIKIVFMEAMIQSKVSLAIFLACFVSAAVLCLLFKEVKGWTLLNCVQNLMIWDLMFAAASIDLKVKKIPNKLILLMLGIRALGIVGQIIQCPSLWLNIVLTSVIGMLVGGVIILVCYFISRGGIGVGDLKMFATIGFYFGLPGVLEIMMYALFLACIVSIFLLVSRKAKFKSSIPMAPFVFIGLSMYLFFL